MPAEFQSLLTKAVPSLSLFQSVDTNQASSGQGPKSRVTEIQQASYLI